MEDGRDVILCGGASPYTATFGFGIFHSATNPTPYHS